ncbi:unnamed protein product, partial [Schistosoma margrebowiei]
YVKSYYRRIIKVLHGLLVYWKCRRDTTYNLPSCHNDADSLQYNTEDVSVDSSKFSSQSIGESINPISGSTLPSFTDSSTISKHSGLVTCQSNRPQYTWRIDLIKTQPFWQGWFSGLSKLFLSIPEPKLLLLADVYVDELTHVPHCIWNVKIYFLCHEFLLTVSCIFLKLRIINNIFFLKINRTN